MALSLRFCYDSAMKQFKSVALAAVKTSGKAILKLQQTSLKYSMKNPRDVLTEADLKSEKIIVAAIKKNFPDHGILSEEMGTYQTGAAYVWVLDPIDGTINYLNKLEEYCISLALTHKGKVTLGIIYQPALNKLFIAEQGKGTFLNGKRLRVSQTGKLINALAATDSSSQTAVQQRNFAVLYKIGTKVRHVRIFGSIALHMARIAEGQLDFHYKARFHFWDCAAGLLLVQEAGGKVTDQHGKTFTAESDCVVSSNGRLHQKVLKLLKDAGL